MGLNPRSRRRLTLAPGWSHELLEFEERDEQRFVCSDEGLVDVGKGPKGKF